MKNIIHIVALIGILAIALFAYSSSANAVGIPADVATNAENISNNSTNTSDIGTNISNINCNRTRLNMIDVDQAASKANLKGPGIIT